MKNLEKMKKNISEGKVALGVFVTIADSCISEIVGYAGYDFVWIDAEHGALDRREIFHHIIAAQSAGAAAFVRVPGVDPTLVKAIMDMGPDGLIFPFIENRQIAELAVKACSYPPRGMRGQGPIRAIRYGIDDEGEYIEKADSAFWTILQIENVEGYNHLDEIMEVEGFDSIFIGPGDLGRSINLPKEEKEIRMKEIMDDMCKRLSDKGITIGTATGSYVPDIEKSAARGAHWITMAQDVRIISNSLRSTLKTIQESMK